MGPKVTEEADAISGWLRHVQGTELGARQVIDPARARQPVGEIVRNAGGGTTLDTEPARFQKLLLDLAPVSLRKGDGTP